MNDDEEDPFLARARREMFPKLKASTLSLTIAGEPDPKLCLELGAAILFDKPIVVLVPPGRNVPANLKRVASVIVEGDPHDPAVLKKISDAMQAVIANDQRNPTRKQ